jgi:hypothetical protein
MKSACLAAVLAAALIFPQTDALAQDKDDLTVPPYAGAYQPQTSDERGLWSQDDESERVLRDSDAVIRDPALNEYVRSVLCRAVGDDRCGNVRIYIVRAPMFNASMTPNGTMRVFSGLLLRVRSEAELASVLGHEFAHFELRHSLDGYRRRRTGTDIAAWALVMGAAAVNWGGATHNSSGDLQVSIYGNIMHFQRNQERFADGLGFGYMTASGYRPSAAAEVWRALMNEADQTALDRGRRSNRYDNVAFFASHPTDLERALPTAWLQGAITRVASGTRRRLLRICRCSSPTNSRAMISAAPISSLSGWQTKTFLPRCYLPAASFIASAGTRAILPAPPGSTNRRCYLIPQLLKRGAVLGWRKCAAAMRSREQTPSELTSNGHPEWPMRRCCA